MRALMDNEGTAAGSKRCLGCLKSNDRFARDNY